MTPFLQRTAAQARFVGPQRSFLVVLGGHMMVRFKRSWLAYALSLVAVGPATAQGLGRGYVSVLVGPSPYDLAGTGTGLAINAGLAWRPLARVLVIEPGIGFFNYRPQLAADRVGFLMPEISVQAEARLGAVRPYVGGGTGAAVRISGGPGQRWDWTLHATAGPPRDLTPRLGLGAGMRLPGIDLWGAKTGDLGFRGSPAGFLASAGLTRAL